MAVERDKFMYGNGSEPLVYLVWEMQASRPCLTVICTNDDVLDRYVTPDRKSLLGDDRRACFVEKVYTNHLYGAVDNKIATRIMRNAR